jgi:hypothetical protein
MYQKYIYIYFFSFLFVHFKANRVCQWCLWDSTPDGAGPGRARPEWGATAGGAMVGHPNVGRRLAKPLLSGRGLCKQGQINK